MLDSIFISAPAKLNLFLRIIGQKKNGYHYIRTGITFLDLHDEISIRLSDVHSLTYSGPFKPTSKIYKNDIISVSKVLKSNFLTQGPNILKFEKSLSKTTESK